MTVSSTDTAVILAFPLPEHITQAEIALIATWASQARLRGRFLRNAAMPGIGGFSWIERTPEGCDRFRVAYGDPGNSTHYSVTRRRRRWLLQDLLDDPIGEFHELQSALDVICGPSPGAA